MPEEKPFLRSVFRAEVLQREIEERERPVVQLQSPPVSLLKLTGVSLVIVAAILGVLNSFVDIHQRAILLEQEHGDDAELVLITAQVVPLSVGDEIRATAKSSTDVLPLSMVAGMRVPCPESVPPSKELIAESLCVKINLPERDRMLLIAKLNQQNSVVIEGLQIRVYAGLRQAFHPNQL